MSDGYIDLRPLTALDFTPSKPEPRFGLVFEGDNWVVISAATGGPVYFGEDGDLMDSPNKEWARSYLAYANDFPHAVWVGPGPAERRAIAEEHERFVRGLAEIIAS